MKNEASNNTSQEKTAGLNLIRKVLLVCGILSSLLYVFMLSIGFGAAAFGKSFRLYSIVTLIILIAFGALTGLNAPRLKANLPTPLIGVWERINIGVYMLWVVVLAITLLRTERMSDSMKGKVR